MPRPIHTRATSLLAVVLLGLLLAPSPAANAAAAARHWNQFRGPDGNGVAAGAKPAVTWSETEKVAWKTPIHGRGWASPVIWDRQIWLATATEDGRRLSAVCVDARSGKVERDIELFQVEAPQFCHKFNSYASPTPVIEKGRVYVTFGSPGTAAIDTRSGKVLWQRRDFECNHYRGAGSSPILHGKLLILPFDGSSHQYLVALDKDTGATAWKVQRSIDFKDLGPDGLPMIEGDLRKAFATPHVAVLDGIPTLLSQGAKALYAYVPESGEELWRVEERQNHSGSTRPVVGHGLVYVPSGFSQGQLLAIHPGRKGEVLDANADAPPEGSRLRIAWKAKRGIPKKPSLILHGDLVFGIEDGGVATCWNALTGEVRWNERLGGDHSAAPIVADNRLYFFSEQGKTYVVAAAAEFRKLAENTLGDGFMASPAVLGNSLVLRSRTHLYRIDP